MAQHRRHDQPRAPTLSGRKRGAEANAIGKSRGGPSTKVHLVVDALGLPVEFDLTVGQRHDSVPAVDLILRASATCVLADKAYGATTIRSALERAGIEAHIPSQRDRIRPPPYDKHLFKARPEVECTFNLFKQARRFATRYEKTLRNYSSMVTLCCILCWLRI
jgi:transposase